MPNSDNFLLAGLEQNELHVWIAATNAIFTPACIDYYYRLLSVDEQEICKKFRFERDRLIYLAAHALLRTTLSRYASHTPEQWRFDRMGHGKPKLSAEHATRPFQFNLSHTGGMVACVVSLENECGIDVESIRPMNDFPAVGEKIFSDFEIAYLARQDEEHQLHAFFSLWTLKEAYAKAIGLGLSAPLKEVAFNLEKNPIEMHFPEQFSDSPAREWLFHLFNLGGTHQLAVAARQTSDKHVIVYREIGLADRSQNILKENRYEEPFHQINRY